MTNDLQNVPTPKREHIHFVTGRLAEHALRQQVGKLAQILEFDYSVDVLPITVAALMTPPWIAARWSVPAGTDRVIVPGYCDGDLQPLLLSSPGIRIERGPRDLRDLPEYLGHKRSLANAEYGQYDIEVLAEINNAPRLDREQILAMARAYRDHGADIIDVGCDPGKTWNGLSDCVRALRDEGLRVSIDSLNPIEIAAAADAGAELVLSVNSSNRDAAVDWNCEVVAIPDDPSDLTSLDETIEFLASRGVRLRIDPILEPIGFGFARSLGRYLQIRSRYPDAEMLMGIGNLTELTDADSAGINVLLLGFCQEVGIRSVLTTQVINWARSSVRECDLARRLVHFAVRNGSPPKHVEPNLVLLRDERVSEFGPEELDRLASAIRDNNYRLFAENGLLHLLSAQLHLSNADPFLLFEQLLQSGANGQTPKNLDAAHAFYLGYEAAKAMTALTLSKQYRQDEALNWGFLTRPEISHRERKRLNP